MTFFFGLKQTIHVVLGDNLHVMLLENGHNNCQEHHYCKSVLGPSTISGAEYQC